MTEHTASPLSWPHGRLRIPAHKRRRAPFGSGFSQRRGEFTIGEATRSLEEELGRLGVRKFILSTNLRLRGDGLPISGQKQPEDPAAAVYFTLAKRETVIACDWWDKVQDNIFAITKHIDALRGQERWGCGSVEQAFAGYQALPPPGQGAIAGEPPRRSWSAVFTWPAGKPLTHETLNAAYRELAKERQHDPSALQELNVARDEARQEIDR